MAVKFLNGIDVVGSMNITANDIPDHSARKITSDTLDAARIPDLSGTYQPVGNYLTSIPSEYLTQTEGDARYLQSLPSHNHDTLYDAIGSAEAVQTFVNEQNFVTDAAIPTNNNQLTNGAGYITSSSLPSGSQLVRVYNNVNYVPSGDADQRGNYGMGVTVYEGYSGGTNRPHTYDTTAQFMSTTSQGFELSVDWVSPNTTPLKIRSLRDCCQGWSDWKDVAVAEDVVNGNFYFADSIQVGSKITHYGDTDTYLVFDTNRIRFIAGNSTRFDSNNTYATTSYVDTAVSNLVSSAPAALDTLNELAAALGDDANFSTTIANNIGAVNTRIDTEVLPAIDAKQNAGNYFTDGDTVLNMANNDGLVYDDTTNKMYVKLDGTNREIYHTGNTSFLSTGGGTLTGATTIQTTGGAMLTLKDTNSAGDAATPYISFVDSAGTRQGYVGIGSGSSAKLYLEGLDGIQTNNPLSVNGTITATGGNSSNWNTAYGWGNHASAGYLTSVPSTYATDAEVSTAVATVDTRIDNEVIPSIPTNNNQLTNGAGYITDGNTNWNNSYGFITEASYIKAGGAGPSSENLNTVADSVVTGELEYRGFNLASSNRPPASDNANGVITVGQHSGNYNAQLAFSSDGNMYWRDNPSTSYGSWRTVWDSGNLDAFVGATVSNDTITFTKANGGTVAVTTSDANTNTWRPIDDTPVNGVTTESISSNWAYDHVNASNPHGTTAADVGADTVGSADAVQTWVGEQNYASDAAINTAIATVTLSSLGYTGATNANYITNNNQLTNGAGYITSYVNTTYTAGSGLKLSGTTFRLNGGEIPAGVDLNTYRTTGIYAQNSNSDTTSGSNWPTNFAGILEVWNDDYGNGIHCTQRYSRYNTVDVYQRNYYNGTWTSWRNLTQDTNTTYSTSDFDAAGSAAAVSTALSEEIGNLSTAVSANTTDVATNRTSITTNATNISALSTSISTGSVTIGSGVTLSESTDRADLLMIKSSTSTWGGLQVSNTSNEIIFSLMGDGTTGGIYDDQNSDWLIQWTENAGVRLYHNAGQKLTTTSTGVSITGALVASGDVTAFSDARIKENVETLPNALESVKQMRGVTYNKIGEEKQSVGVIAQELEEVVPQLVHTDEDGMKSVAYGNITAVLIEALKEQQAQIEELKSRLDGLTK